MESSDTYMEKRKRRQLEERRTLKRAQEVHYRSAFKAADRAAQLYTDSVTRHF